MYLWAIGVDSAIDIGIDDSSHVQRNTGHTFGNTPDPFDNLTTTIVGSYIVNINYCKSTAISALLPATPSRRGIPRRRYPPVPEEIVTKIRKGEFIEMGELLPEFWSPRGDDSDSGRESKGRRSRKATDIFTGSNVS